MRRSATIDQESTTAPRVVYVEVAKKWGDRAVLMAISTTNGAARKNTNAAVCQRILVQTNHKSANRLIEKFRASVVSV